MITRDITSVEFKMYVETESGEQTWIVNCDIDGYGDPEFVSATLGDSELDQDEFTALCEMHECRCDWEERAREALDEEREMLACAEEEAWERNREELRA